MFAPWAGFFFDYHASCTYIAGMKLEFTVTPEQAAVIQDAAAEAALPVASWLRMVAMSAAQTRQSVRPITKETK